MKNKETGFICDWKYFMTHSCEKCPIARLCQEFEDKQKEKPEIEKKEALSKLSKRVMQYDLNNNYIKTWDSVKNIERTLGINKASISKCCNNKQKTSNGYIWRFE